MNEISLTNNDSDQKIKQIAEPNQDIIITSTKEQIDDLASDLADGYTEFLVTDLGDVKRKRDDAIEECLIHLEEVGSVLEMYRQNSGDIGDIVAEMSSKKEVLEELYGQIDSLEQHVLETKKTLEQLEDSIKELENHKRSLNSNTIRQMIDNLLPSGFGNIFGQFSSNHQNLR